MMTDALPMGTEDGPISPANYKRAVLRSAPSEFTVEVLSPTKQGSNFSYGLRVCPVIRSKHSSDSRSVSSRSTTSYSEYEIWRRWEDCLDFQETLEAEYSKMSRQKVKVLKRGGKKKSDNGPYTLNNAAASFDSLPEGPDPREVAVNVHKLIPPLTRKGTIFRVSRSTLKQRGEEFAAMIQALFDPSDDAPVLLQELRNTSAVRDFFGFWRRDKDLAKKSGKDVSRLFHSNHSLSSLSMSTTPSSPASSMFPTTPMSMVTPARHSMFMRSPPSRSQMPASAPPASRRFVPESPEASQSFTSSQYDRFVVTADVPDGSIMFTDELLLEDDLSQGVESNARRRPITYASAPKSAPLWGSREMQPAESHMSRTTHPGVPHPIPEDDLPLPLPRARSNSAAAPEHRNARIFVSAPNSPLPPPHEPQSGANPRTRTNGHTLAPLATGPIRHAELLSVVSSPSSAHSPAPSSRPSSMSMNRFSVTSSVSSYTQAASQRSSSSHESHRSCDSESCVDLELPFTNSPIILHTPLSEIAEKRNPRLGHKPRDSTSSFASFRTESSADGVLPPHIRSPPPHRRQRSLSVDARANNTTPMMDHRAPSLIEESESGEDLIDAYFDDSTDGLDMSLETMHNDLPRFISHGGKHSVSSISSAGSLVTSESQAPWSQRDDAFAVKAVYRDSVIVFRAERSMPLATIRQRIKDRFELHESVPLEQDFLLACFPSRAPAAKAGATGSRGRSNSVASSTADVSQLRLLRTEVDWQAAMTTCGGKVTLRVLDAATPI